MTRPRASATPSDSARLEARLRQIGGRPDAEIDLGEAGALHGELGDLRAAIASLQYALHLGLRPAETEPAAELLGRLRGSLH